MFYTFVLVHTTPIHRFRSVITEFDNFPEFQDDGKEGMEPPKTSSLCTRLLCDRLPVTRPQLVCVQPEKIKMYIINV